MLKTEGIQLYFDRGINPISGLLTTMINAGRVETSGKGYYKINDPWAGGKEAKFQASREKNLVPIETLLEFPTLVDAKDTEELKVYLETFGNAVDMIPDNGDISETAMDADDIDDDDKQAQAIMDGKKEE